MYLKQAWLIYMKNMPPTNKIKNKNNMLMIKVKVIKKKKKNSVNDIIKSNEINVTIIQNNEREIK